MADRKIIAVVGATGAQGNGLVRAIQADPTGGFVARALTRDPGSAKARALADLGAEVVAADVDDEASLERAFAGAHGAYCVTFFWDHMSPEREIDEAGKLARAASRAGVRHAIWSTLEDTRRRVPLADDRMPTLGGKYKVPHFDAKGEADAIFAASGVPTTYLLTSFYWDNLVHFGMGPKPGPDGTLLFTLPMGKARLPGIAARDIGACAYGVFRRGTEFVGKHVGICGGQLTGDEMAAAMARAFGRPVKYNEITPATYRGFGFPGADDLGNMFQYKRDFEREFCGARDLALSRALDPQLLSFDAWLAQNKDNIALA